MTKAGILLLLGALAAGGAVGYVAGSAGGGAPIGPMPVEGPATPERVREVYVPGRTDAGTGGAGSLADLLEGLDGGGAAQVGTGRITGRVETEDGQPLANVVLRAEAIEERPYARDTSGAPPEEKDLVEAVEELVRNRRKTLSARREGRSDASGVYAIEGLTDAKYRVNAYCRGWQIRPKPGTRTYTMKAGDTADFIAKPLVGIPVVIRTPDGSDPKKAYLLAKGGQYPRNYPWSKEHATIHLEPGEYTLQAMAGEFGEMKSDEREVRLEAGRAVEEMVFAVDIRPGIRGKITFPAGASMPWCQVFAMPVIAGQEPDPERLSGSQKQGYANPNRPEYVLADLEPGTWLVGISLGNSQIVEHKTVEVGSGMVTLDFVIPEPDPDESVLVRVEAPDGKLLKTARVWGGYSAAGGGPLWGGRQATMQEDGSWRVPHYSRPDFEPSEDGAFTITASDPRYGQKQVEYDRATTRELTIRFDPPGTLIVTVTGYKGTVYQDATRLSLMRKNPDGGRGNGVSSPGFTPFGFPGGSGIDKDGVQKMPNLAPGDYELQVFLHGKQWNQHLVHKEDVAVKPGENRVTVALPPLFDVAVLVPAPGEGEKHTYSLTPLQRDRSTPWSSPPAPKVEGTRVTFSSVPAGRYTVNISGGRVPQRMVVDVPGSGVVRFAAQVFSAKYVTIDDETGYLAAAGLKTGDLVIGLDGVEFKDSTHMGARFMEARAKESTQLMVLRAGKRFTATVDLKLTRGPKAGGSWRDSVR